jgi:PAS domain S-box-containing protein
VRDLEGQFAMQDGRDALLNDLRVILESTVTAVLLKDGDGYCLFANRAAESLLAYEPGQLSGIHMTDLGSADARLISMEYERLKREKVWMGRYPVRRRDGGIVLVAANALAVDAPDGSVLCAEFLYPVSQHASTSGTPTPELGADLTTRDLSLLQLLVEGFSDDQLAALLGTRAETAREPVHRLLLTLNASSRTEACVRALKAHLVL